MSRDIRLYWWRKNDTGINVGDEMNKAVVEHVSGRKVVRAALDDAELLAIGSVLNFPKKNLNLRREPWLVWGSGAIANADRSRQELFHCTAVRGPLTFSLLRNHAPIPFGDPGILASVVWPAKPGKTHRWGIVPHMVHAGKPWVKKVLEATPGATVIDVTNPDLSETMAQIAACDFIASSSLHGLIISDSYNVPSVWLNDGGLKGGSWKFWDYFAGVNRRTGEGIDVNTLGDLRDLEKALGRQHHFATLGLQMKKLVQVFPL